MRMGIVGKKVGMTQLYNEAGAAIPVTVIDVSGCSIAQVKTRETDGYNALQVAVGVRKPQNVSRPLAGHLKKAKLESKRSLQEIRLDDDVDMTQFKAGDTLSASMFESGDKVDIAGISIGKGFQGVMKKFHFRGKPATHGTHKYYRHGGSIGCATFPGRVMKNKKMPGQMGNRLVSQMNSKLEDVRADDNLLLVKGGVPGSKNSYVLIRSAIKRTLPKDRSWTGKAAEPAAEAAPEDQPQDK